ncbi:MAG: hypothetical protein LC127_07900, partial [Chitinophagales bacterium]|nr:hypothetical protein [Chitinophagales bacterium]
MKVKKIFLLFFLLSILLVGPKSFSQASFTTPGTYTWTVPPCVTSVTVKVWGGGGGGGGAIAIARNSTGDEACSGAGGGGGAGFSMKTFAVTPGETYNIVVGAGGIAGSSGDGTWSGGIT